MKAAVIYAYGGREVLEIAELPRPVLLADDVLVRVHAAAVNPKDTFIRKGRFKRFTGAHFPLQMGFDFAGEIVESGSRLHQLSEGDPVYGLLDGWRGAACAEYVSVPAANVARKPDSLSFTEAAALPMVSLTALGALRDEARIEAGMSVCINGASGGVGSMAVQIAKIFGASVTAISRAENHDLLFELGADRCVDYRQVDITQSGHTFDIFFDVFGNQPFRSVKPSLSRDGVWVSTVLKSHVYLSVAMTRWFGRKKAKLVVVKSRRADLDLVRDWVAVGRLRPLVQEVFLLNQIREAHKQQETKHTRGKVVVVI